MKLRVSCLLAACFAMARTLIPELRRIWHRAKSDAIRERLMASNQR